MTKGEITREYDITIYCQSAVNSDMYFMLDAEENEYGIYDLVVYHGVYDYELLEDSAEIYLIGEVFGDQFEGDSWINAMVELFEGQGMLPTSTYLYGQPDLFWVPLYFSVYAAESQTGFIPFIICQFLLGEDLSAYDNNDGRCIISYKDINLSEDGWMDLFDFSSGEGFPLSLLFI